MIQEETQMLSSIRQKVKPNNVLWEHWIAISKGGNGVSEPGRCPRSLEKPRWEWTHTH